MESKYYSVKIEGGDEISLRLELDGSVIKSHEWNIVGSLKLLAVAASIKKSFPSTIEAISFPEGAEPATLLVKELLMRVKNQWSDGDDDPEICHCRKISQRAIERAVILGAHTLEKVRKRTSANTGCGACMPDVQELIAKRLG